MKSNLQGRGIFMPGIVSLEKYQSLLQESGWSVDSAESIWDWWVREISSQEAERLNTIEYLDEIEQMRLMFQHYCIINAKTQHNQ